MLSREINVIHCIPINWPNLQEVHQSCLISNLLYANRLANSGTNKKKSILTLVDYKRLIQFHPIDNIDLFVVYMFFRCMH